MGIHVLAGLLDEKLIKVISLFMKHPEKKFYLSEVVKLAGVNAATTFRILNKLVKEDLLKATIIGKVRAYELSKSERANSLSKLLKKEESDVLSEFCSRIKVLPRIRIIILDSKTHNSARLIIVGDYPSKERIDRICNEFSERKKFHVSFVELTVQQYEALKGSSSFNLDKKILFKRSS